MCLDRIPFFLIAPVLLTLAACGSDSPSVSTTFEANAATIAQVSGTSTCTRDVICQFSRFEFDFLNIGKITIIEIAAVF